MKAASHTAIGLQGRHSPAVRRAAELVSSGKIGRPTVDIQTEPVRGGDYSAPFDCVGDDQGYGDLNVTNLQSGIPDNFPSVRDNQDLPM
jgi:hypothetical protein